MTSQRTSTIRPIWRRQAYNEEEFTRIVLDKLGNEGTLENPILLWQEGTFDVNKYKITGYSLPDEEDRLLLATTVYTGDLPPRQLTSMRSLQHSSRHSSSTSPAAADFMKGLIRPTRTPATSRAASLIWMDRSVFFAWFLSRTVSFQTLLLICGASDGTRIVVDMFGIEQLYHVLGEGLTHDDIVVDFEKETGQPLPCLKASSDGSSYDAYLAAIPGGVLESAYEKYGARLLELNVRAFLGVRGRKSVNAGLRKTILEEPSNFLAFNNGIVAIADEIELSTKVSWDF